MPALAAFVRHADALIRLVGRSAAWLVLATVLICAGVALSRYLLGFGRIWLQELYVVCFAVCFLLAAPYAYATDSHIRIEILHQRWTARTQAWIEIVGCLLCLIPWLLLLLWSTLPFVRLSWRVLEPSAQPGGLPGLYLVKAMLPLFAVLMLLQALAVIGRKTLFLAGRADLLRPEPGLRHVIDATGELLAVGLFVTLCAALMLGFPVAFTLAGVSLLFAWLGHLLGHFDFVFFLSLAPRYFGVMLNETLVAVPLFIFMGMVLERSRIAEELLRTLGVLLGSRPGGLGYAVVVVGAILAASTGVVGAVVITMSLISLPTMLRAGYDPRLATGVIGASATLAQLIPPSTVLIFIADILQGVNQTAQLRLGNLAPAPVSVGDLFAGAFLPGLLLVGLFLLWMAWKAWRNPASCPPLTVPEAERRALLRQIPLALVAPLVLIVSVLGSILAGIATATESASLGAIGAVLFTALRGRLTFGLLREACLRTALTTAMIFVILLGASVFSLVFRGLGGEALVEEALRAMPGGAVGAMAVCMAVMFVLGFFLDTFEIIFIMLPIFGPPLILLGYDPLWLGVMIGLNLQTSFLTPPFGATLFYLRSAAPPEITTADIWRGSITPTWLQLAALVLVWLFPALATWLPRVIFG